MFARRLRTCEDRCIVFTGRECPHHRCMREVTEHAHAIAQSHPCDLLHDRIVQFAHTGEITREIDPALA